ncbi:MAG: ester cyclase [Oceanicaulis sp.]
MADARDANREILRLQIEDLWGKGRVELIDQLYTDDVTDHMPLPGQPPGVSGLRQVVEQFHAALPDLQITVHGVLAEEDRALDFWTLEATHTGEVMGLAPTGNRIRFSGIDMVRIRDGRISDIWHVEELLQMIVQMGGDPVAFGRPLAAAPQAGADTGAGE